MHLGLDLAGKVVAVIVATGTKVSALLAAEILLVVYSEGPGLCTDQEGAKGEENSKLHCEISSMMRRWGV